MRFVRFKLVGFAVGGFAMLLAATCAMPFISASGIDADARRQSEALVQRNVALWIDDVENALKPWTIWDEPIAMIDNALDIEWTDRNIGQSLMGMSGHRFTAVIDAQDAPVYWKVQPGSDAEALLADGLDAAIRHAADLVRAVRDAEPRAVTNAIPEKIAISRVEVVRGAALLLTASLFQPDFRTAVPKGPRAPILLTAMPVAGGLVQTFGERFLLDDARLTHADEIDSDRASIVVATDDAARPLALSWLAPRPGEAMIRQAMPLMATSIVLLLGAAGLAFDRSRRVANALIERERRSRREAAHDLLTDLPNRRGFEAVFAHRVPQGPFALVCMDLDGFKPVNDRFGHVAGDAVLRAVADRLRACCGPEQEAFRLGGDEFALILPILSAREAAQFCRQLSAVLNHPIECGMERVRVGASFGIASAGLAGETASAALTRADAALYRAKAQAPNGACRIAIDETGGGTRTGVPLGAAPMAVGAAA